MTAAHPDCNFSFIAFNGLHLFFGWRNERVFNICACVHDNSKSSRWIFHDRLITNLKSLLIFSDTTIEGV